MRILNMFRASINDNKSDYGSLTFPNSSEWSCLAFVSYLNIFKKIISFFARLSAMG